MDLIKNGQNLEKSPYYKYVDFLPKIVDNFPIFLKETEKALLKGSSALKFLEKNWISKLRSNYDLICEAVSEFKEQISLFDFQKSQMLVWSRAIFF